jgi:hypothetical protein
MKQTSIPCPESQFVYDQGIDHVLQRQQLKDSLKANPRSKLGFKNAADYARFQSKFQKDMAKIEAKFADKAQGKLF